MVGGRFRCLSCLFTYIIGLFLGVFLHDVAASEGKQVIHKKVGDSVELSSGLSNEGVTRATWKYGSSTAAIIGSGVTTNNIFQSRVELNNTSYSLTIRKLTLQDSGNFSFNSATNNGQRPIVVITLLVHEPISNQPILFFNISGPGSNGFCTVFLECRAASQSNIAYIWTVGNQTYEGPMLSYTIRPQDGDTTFTCNASNVVSASSAFKLLRCSNNTDSFSDKGISPSVWILSAAGGGLLIIIIIIGVSVSLCKRRWSGSDSNELTVYADITDFSPEVGTSDKPCSLYDTIEDRNSPGQQMPQTVYDKIQIQRMRKASVSPYQEVS